MEYSLSKLNKYDVLSILLIFCFSSIVDINIELSPDSKLYYGLALNILDGVGFYDTIRNNEILPSVGHPLIIAIITKLNINGLLYSYLILSVSFILIHLSILSLGLSRIISLILILILIVLIPSIDIWSIELSIISTLSLCFFLFVNFYKKQSLFRFILIIISLLLVIIVRPILLPFIYLLLPLIVYFLYKNTNIRRIVLPGLGVLFATIFFIQIYSNFLYKDNRLLMGTYSSIPLYCAWNSHINLKKGYSSTLWNSANAEEKENIFNIFNQQWQIRDTQLKKEIINFIIEKPNDAIEGYLWRLSKYSILPYSISYLILFYLWIILIILFIFNIQKISKKDKNLFFFFVGLALYIILITAVFIFAGKRYYVTPALCIIFSIVISSSILVKNNIIANYKFSRLLEYKD